MNTAAARRTALPFSILVVAAVIFAAPLVVALLTSLKSPSEITRVIALPNELYFQNYAIAYDRMGRSFLNSIAITVPSVILSLLVGAISGYPLAYMRGAGGRAVYFFLLTGMIVPFQIVQIPLFFLIRSIGLYDSIPGMWLVHTAYSVPFCTFFMRNFFASVPRSMYEAALIDGCTPAGYFWRLLLPASGSGLAALAIIQSRAIWNDLLFAITLTTSDKATPVTATIAGFASSLQVEYGPLMAATLISLLPVMVTYLLFQKAFVRGLLGGAGK
ncbi:carbohydrate ABC transporter permease [Mesorhizobium sp. YC-39]|uniref:carbohydrate ABC transporter permease n=1 Tax=unclassified Mesorhizobium TaxID=325217 RepID=UPI0021E98E09|nr:MULTISPECIES: carbohydrate ABC transporter permease [unclassified Mesorhizobium]MCV3205243.1 carbohydrate ABC transporter permease [Mesorhizobium sp. YC-2]MCV3228358.1 carbohydrate ABC transporter permease [Mesorhizobium sp. YC-39]